MNSLFDVDKKRIWTPSAIECLKNHFRCGLCPLNKIIESKCIMKDTVLKIIKKYGMPEEYTEPTIRED